MATRDGRLSDRLANQTRGVRTRTVTVPEVGEQSTCMGVTSGEHAYEDIGYGASCLHCGVSAPTDALVNDLRPDAPQTSYRSRMGWPGPPGAVPEEWERQHRAAERQWWGVDA